MNVGGHAGKVSVVRSKGTYIFPAVAAFFLSISLFLPYWHLKVTAPQYPKGLHVSAYLDRVAGDVREIDTLNHYIGMRPLGDAAKMERRLSIIGVSTLAALLLISGFLPRPAVFGVGILVVFFPLVFVADLYWWLRDFGLHLNPRAPLSSSVKPFIPPLFGAGKIAQFHATAHFSAGFYFASVSAALAGFTIYLRGLSKDKKTLKILALAAFILGLPLQAVSSTHAATIHVSARGRALQHAVDRAAAGDTLVVSGSYQGPLVIRKKLTLTGERMPVIDARGKGTVVRIDADDVTFKGFVVRSSGDLLANEDTGILVSGKRVVIENNRFEDVLFGVHLHRSYGGVVRGNTFKGKNLDIARRGDLIRVWYSDDAVIERNRTIGGRDVVLWFSKNMRVEKNEFSHGRYGLHFMYCKQALVAGNELTYNSVGAYLMYSAGLKLFENIIMDNRGPSGYGIGFKDMEGAVIEGNLVSGNRVGFFLDSSVDGICRQNLIAYNDIGVQLFPTARHNRFASNNFIDNAEQALVDGQSVQSVNDWRGNYWSDYRGFDAGHDGVGDVAYRPMKLFERLSDRDHGLKIFFGSPSVQAVDFAASVFPVFAPTAKFTDERPLMDPAPIALKAERPRSQAAWNFLSLGLLLPLVGFFRGLFGMPQKNSARFACPRAEAPIIRVRRVVKRYGRVTALRDLELEIRAGETIALWGPNGAGKTTLFRCLLGILPFEGEIRVDGFDVKTCGTQARGRIGYLPQEIRFHEDQSVWETLLFYAAIRGVGRDRVEKLLMEWGLSPARRKSAQSLSGGMKQRLALCVALLSDPPILFFDEPTSSLDVDARFEFDRALERLKKDGKTLIFCSHRYAEIRRIADRVIMLEEGVKKMDGPPGHAFSKISQSGKSDEF